MNQDLLRYQVGDIIVGGKLFRQLEESAGTGLDTVRIYHQENLVTFAAGDSMVSPPGMSGAITTWQRRYHVRVGRYHHVAVAGLHAWELIEVYYL